MPATLIDTHTFVWLVTGPAKRFEPARSHMADPDRQLYLSEASGWELAHQAGTGQAATQGLA